ncbi:MAG: PLP-dependent aminotransferase family protein [Gammaproteobacteria bacterium]
MKLYEELAGHVSALIQEGTLQPGERVPSVRQIVRERRVSPATAMRAYELLESRGLIETRPRSGYYVSEPRDKHAPEPRRGRASARTTRVDVSELVFQILDAARDRDVVPLGSAFPSPLLFPWPKLARYLGSAARHMDPWSTVESLPPGSLDLRRQIARRYLKFGTKVSADEIIITCGALEGLNISLQVLTRPGDAVAVEAPAFYACLQSIEALGLKAVEIPTDPREGVDLGALAQAIDKHAIRACWFMTTFQNPLGATMPEAKKRDLVKLLEKHDVPLIEDDVYAELYFGEERPRPAKAFDTKGGVLHCGSFSKCLAPGYRLGWVAAGKFATAVQRRKITTSISTSLPVQDGIALLLRQDGYDAHLAKLRRTLASQQGSLLSALQKHLPNGYRVTRPEGGYFLWVELPRGVDSLEVHRLALDQGISVAPGPIFSPRREFRNCLRLNYGHPWSAELDGAVAKLGKIISQPPGGCRHA